MSGSDSFESIKISFADAWNEISEVIADGEVEIKSGQKVPVEVCWGGDYKVCIIKIPIFMQMLIINYKFVSTMTVLGSLCLDGYFIASINSFFLLSVGEVRQIPIMPASGPRYINMKGNK